ncbi:MAG: ABC transporter ATP-binding protein [Actinomycetales bacterium]|nr:ABC transporter ATP-binding protein [Actinomycetales bacterium]
MTPALLETRGFSHRFGTLLAVDDVTMHVEPGEVVGLLGANGAGKTTLIRALLGLVGSPDGQVRLLGGPPSRQARMRVGYVPQGMGLYDDLTVAENLEFTARAYRARVPQLPPDLAEHSGTLVGSLALGSQRRLAFVCALLHDPEVLVLDEPTSGVDPLARARLWDTVRERAEAGVGVLITTHYMQEAQQCDRLLLMAGGRLVGSGSEEDVVGGTTAVEVRTERWADAFAALEPTGAAVTLSGRSVRVADGDEATLRAVLAQAGVPAELVSVPATIEERMAVLAKDAVR